MKDNKQEEAAYHSDTLLLLFLQNYKVKIGTVHFDCPDSAR
ncbi:hypothetical protein SAMN05660841_01980 [Sphingobacterium nematocida]|uniref:Uncharacterized protein n=1 Tax=Sphingobacterium nematocida TaxID=1513896 RepID=A0A1T5DHR1_9SPHI|nr:hypothetical protein SAMN05660841_01980 [Sphingobacterium nematocida]